MQISSKPQFLIWIQRENQELQIARIKLAKAAVQKDEPIPSNTTEGYSSAWKQAGTHFSSLNKVATVQTKTANTKISWEEQQTGAVNETITTFDNRTSSLEPF